MNKSVAILLAGALIAAAAGTGAYLALRQGPAGAAAERAAAPAAALEAAAPLTTIETSATEAAETAPAAAPPSSAVPGGAPNPPAAPAASPAPGTPRSTAPAAPGAPAAGPGRSASDAAPQPPDIAGASAATPPASDAPIAPVQAAAPQQVPADEAPAALPVEAPVTGASRPRTFEEFVVPADSVLGVQLGSSVSSEVAKVEDPVEARVIRDVFVGNDVAIPTGTRVVGSVIAVERGGTMRTSAKISVRFHTLVFADGTRVAIDTGSVSREGRSPGKETAAKVGGAAIGGAIIGGIVGGQKGAIIGGAVGAAGGTAAQAAGGRNPAVLASGTVVSIRLREPVTVVVER